MKTQSTTPCTIGRTPTCLITFLDNPAPIRKRVTVNPFFANQTNEPVTVSGIVKKVLATIARMKRR